MNSSVMIKLAACNVGGWGRSSKKPVSKQTLLIEILSQMSTYKSKCDIKMHVLIHKD